MRAAWIRRKNKVAYYAKLHKVFHKVIEDMGLGEDDFEDPSWPRFMCPCGLTTDTPEQTKANIDRAYLRHIAYIETLKAERKRESVQTARTIPNSRAVASSIPLCQGKGQRYQPRRIGKTPYR